MQATLSHLLRLGATAGALSLAPVIGQVEVDPRLPAYTPTSAVSGTIKSVGSDTMNNMMSLWGEGFRRVYPNVQIEVEGKGSSTAPPALQAGTATFGPMSRDMKQAEIDEFRKKHGYEPVALRTSLDMLAVFVNKDNPIADRGLSMRQVDAIFSKTRKGGHEREIRTWGDLGLTGEWKDKPLSLYGRNSASGTYGFFKEHALFGGDFSDRVKEQPGSSSVVQGVASDRFGIGYSGIGYRTADVRAVPIAVEGEEYVPAEAEFAYSGDYPLQRALLLYVNYKPGMTIDPLRREFVKYIFSEQGQQDVIKDGYLPVPAILALADCAKLGIELQLDEARPAEASSKADGGN